MIKFVLPFAQPMITDNFKSCNHICNECTFNEEDLFLTKSKCKISERVPGDMVTKCTSFKRAK